MKKRRLFHILAVSTLLLSLHPSALIGQTAGTNYALIVGGLAGKDYEGHFQQYLLETYKAMTGALQFPEENVFVLAESVPEEEQFVDGVSNAENILKYCGEIAGRATEDDHVYVLLFGHGSYDGRNAKFNIPGRDLSDVDFADQLDGIGAGRIVFINTTSASFPFIEALAFSRRIVIAATKSPTERNITQFPEFIVKGMTDPAADADKDGRLSVLELFNFAAENTERFYGDKGYLATEHAVIDDDGDGTAARLGELEATGDGALSAVTYLQRSYGAVFAGGAAAEGDSTLIALLKQKERLELEISTLKSMKDGLSEDDYFAKLEELMTRLALVSREIEKHRDRE